MLNQYGSLAMLFVCWVSTSVGQPRSKYYTDFTFGSDAASVVYSLLNRDTEPITINDDPTIGKISVGIGRWFQQRNVAIEVGGCVFFNTTYKRYQNQNNDHKVLSLEVSNYTLGGYIKPNWSYLLIDENGKKGELAWNVYCDMHIYVPYSISSYSFYRTTVNQQGQTVKGDLYRVERAENKGNLTLSIEPGTNFSWQFSESCKVSLGLSWSTVNWSSSIRQFNFTNMSLFTDAHLVYNLLIGSSLYVNF